MLDVSIVAEFLADEFAQYAVAFAVKNAYLFDAQ